MFQFFHWRHITIIRIFITLWIHGIEFDFWGIIVMMNIFDQKRKLVVRTFNAFDDTHKRQQVVVVTPHDWKMTSQNMKSCFNMRWTLVPMHMTHIFVLKVMLSSMNFTTYIWEQYFKIVLFLSPLLPCVYPFYQRIKEVP
jgi:hypothetical protein